MDMGIVPGTEIFVEGIAPLGDPMEIRVRGYHLTLRKNEASSIFVEVIRDDI
jgi:Fe2+ transport system protein FeoA